MWNHTTSTCKLGGAVIAPNNYLIHVKISWWCLFLVYWSNVELQSVFMCHIVDTRCHNDLTFRRRVKWLKSGCWARAGAMHVGIQGPFINACIFTFWVVFLSICKPNLHTSILLLFMSCSSAAHVNQFVPLEQVVYNNFCIQLLVISWNDNCH